MKAIRFILIMILAISTSSLLTVGCSSSKINTNKEVYTEKEVSKIKKDLSKKISKAIEESGLRVVEEHPDGSFVLSLGNLEPSKDQPKQVLNYSFTKDDKRHKEILDLHCVKDYSKDEKLLDDDKFVKAIYNIFKSLTDTKLTQEEFFKKVGKTFNEGNGTVDLPNNEDISVQVKPIDASTKILELQLTNDFTLK